MASEARQKIRRLEELHEMAERLEAVDSRLEEHLTGLLSEVDDDAAQDLTRAVQHRLSTALRARSAARDLASLLGAEDFVEAVQLVSGWSSARSRDPSQARVGVVEDDSAYEARGLDVPYLGTGMSFIGGVAPGDAESHWVALRGLMRAGGIEVVVEGVEEPGSIFRKWAFRLTRRKLRNLAEGTAAAVNDSYVRGPGAAATLALAQASAALLNASEGEESAHILENLIVGRYRGADGALVAFSRELTLDQRRAIETDRSVLSDPARLAKELNAPSRPVGELGAPSPSKGLPPGVTFGGNELE